MHLQPSLHVDFCIESYGTVLTEKEISKGNFEKKPCQ
uniref:Uncharacterized protein n=1 Tax=Arundo donax TaxID=35708 RepID=A0A0A9BJB6_ARUDO